MPASDRLLAPLPGLDGRQLLVETRSAYGCIRGRPLLEESRWQTVQ